MVVFQTAGFTAVLIILAIMLGTFLEHRFGMFSRATILWHVLINSEVVFRIDAVYGGDIPFDYVKDEAKTVFREIYDEVAVEHDTKDTLELDVDDHFTATLEDQGDEITFDTNKIISTRRAIHTDIDQLFTAMAEFERRSRAQTKDPATPFKEHGVTVDVFLPHKNKYIDFHLPLGAWVTEHTFKITHTKFDWSISYAGKQTTIHANTRKEARHLVSSVIGPFLTF